MKFVTNAWYVAGWASEFSDELRRVTILDRHVVMFRASNDKVVALEDRCPHRLLPLSMGKRVGDAIQCGYHGMTFDNRGKCVRVPGQDNVPEAASVAAFPVHQKHDIVWIWMGEPGKADASEIFDLPQFSDEKWDAHLGEALHIKSNYLNVAENLVDPAHVAFVHPTTLGNAAAEDVPVHATTDGDVILAWRWIRGAEPIGFFKAFGGFTGNVDRWHYYYLHLPSIAVIDFGSAAVEDKIAEDDRDNGVRLFAIHFLTPVSADYTIDRWMHLRNTAINDEAVSDDLDNLFRTAFAEDVEILEAIQLEEERSQKARPVRIAIDKGPMVYRKRINDLLEKEGATQTPKQ